MAWLPGREPQLDELARVAGLGLRLSDAPNSSDTACAPAAQPAEAPAPVIVVYGGASTGKSSSVALALRRRAAAFALVDCAAVYSAQDLYREALAQLYKNAADRALQAPPPLAEDAHAVVVTGGDDSSDSFEGYASLNFLSFVKALDEFMDRSGLSSGCNSGSSVLYLALDHADRLLDRGLAPLLTCILTINEQLSYSHILDDAPPWKTCVLLVTRGVSAALDRLAGPFFPVHICFPPYSPDQIVAILTAQLGLTGERRAFRRWALHLHGLLPPSPQGDWLEFRACVVHLLPEFRSQLQALEAALEAADSSSKPGTPTSGTLAKRLMRDTTRSVTRLLQTRRRHLFGYDKLRRPGTTTTTTVSTTDRGAEDELLACASLSRGCLLLVLAGYLASFNPQESDAKFLSSAGGPRRKKRRSKKDQDGGNGLTSMATTATPQHVSQRLIGPRIFSLQRLFAIYLNLRAEATADADEAATREAREDIFTHLATLVRMQLFQRTSPPTVLDDIKFRCLADWRFVHEAARFLRFPIEAYLYS